MRTAGRTDEPSRIRTDANPSFDANPSSAAAEPAVRNVRFAGRELQVGSSAQDGAFGAAEEGASMSVSDPRSIQRSIQRSRVPRWPRWEALRTPACDCSPDQSSIL